MGQPALTREVGSVQNQTQGSFGCVPPVPGCGFGASVPTGSPLAVWRSGSAIDN